MGFMSLSYNGFRRYRKRRKNLTFVLISVFSVTSFFLAFFSTVQQNLWAYWVKGFIGGNVIVKETVVNYDINTPIPPEEYIDCVHFQTHNTTIISMVSPRLRTAALFEQIKGSNSSPCIITGIDLEKEHELNPYLRVSEGRLFRPGRNEVVLAEAVAANISARLGDEIVIYVKTKEGYPNYDVAKVVGFLDLSAASEILGQHMAYMSLDRLRELLQTQENEASELLYVGRGGLFSVGFRRVGTYRLIRGLSTFSLVRSLSLAFSFLEMIILLLVISFAWSSIYHNVAIMVAERTGEIGVYLTYGAKPFWLRGMFLSELGIYIVYCAALGGMLSFLLVAGVNKLGLYPVDIATEMLMASSHFTIKFDFLIFLSTLLILMAIVTAASIGPIWEATGSSRVVGLFASDKLRGKG